MIKINDKAKCCGCSACVQRCPRHCIQMEEDSEGFLYPHVDLEKCIDCHLCEKVCPVINQNEARTPLAVYAAKNPNEQIRLRSSSGGVFTILAERIIDDGGVVFGACWDEVWNIRHGYAESKDDLEKFRGSKYIQSVIGGSFKKAELFLNTGRKVMFTGTPCQIAGLKYFLRKEYANLLAVEVICHSVPSPGIWQQYLSEKLSLLNWKKADVCKISFRDKRTGWKRYSFVIEKKDGSVFIERHEKNTFMRGFLTDLYTRPSCEECPAKHLKSGSDITLGDFWGIGALMPKLDDDKGVSAVVVNTDVGQRFLQCLDDLNFITASWEDLCEKNPALVISTRKSCKKELFFLDNSLSFDKKIRKFCRHSLTVRRIIKKLKGILHIIKLKIK